MSIEWGPRSHQFTLEEVVKTAREKALRDGRHIPTIIIEGSHKSAVGQITEFPEAHEDKLRRMRSAGCVLSQKENVGELEQVFLICEVWLSGGKEGEPSKIRLSQDSNSKEVLMVTHLVLKGPEAAWVGFEMKRAVDGQLAALNSLPQMGEEGQMENPLLTAFMEGYWLGTRVGIN